MLWASVRGAKVGGRFGRRIFWLADRKKGLRRKGVAGALATKYIGDCSNQL